jgi:hypothetical protein
VTAASSGGARRTLICITQRAVVRGHQRELPIGAAIVTVGRATDRLASSEARSEAGGATGSWCAGAVVTGVTGTGAAVSCGARTGRALTDPDDASDDLTAADGRSALWIKCRLTAMSGRRSVGTQV